ncbi:MAG: molybdenum cofactor guanylyltransferase [Gemmatimonadaceae bacterium]
MIGRHVSGAVLAGGGSTRFGGRPKGLAELDGRRLIDRVLDALHVVADDTFVIANDPAVRAALSDIPVFGDVRPQRASLIGLHSALSHCRDGALVIGWDMPFVSPALLRHLRDIGVAACAAVIPVGPRGPEPLCAYYPRSVLSVIERQIDARELRLSAFVDALSNGILIPAGDVSRFGEPAIMFANINTMADLDHLTVAPHLEHQ